MYGVIDIGSNTIRLVIYKLENKILLPMINKKYSVGLASYINEDNYLKPRGVDKAIEALMDFKEILTYLHVEEIFPFATASLRNIVNSAAVLQQIEDRTNFNIRILSGEEEAVFDYYGVTHSINIDKGLMVDVGGGSSEIVFFENKKAKFSTSLPCGSLKLFKQFVSHIIPTEGELVLMQKLINENLAAASLPRNKYCAKNMVAVGGSARAVHKLLIDMDLKHEDAYDVSVLADLISDLRRDSANLYRNILKSSADRIHTFTPGLLLLKEIADYCGSETVITSDYGVREGYLYYMLEQRAVL